MTTAHNGKPHPTHGELTRRQWVRDVAIAGTVIAGGGGVAACSTSTPTPSGPAPGAAARGSAPRTVPTSVPGTASSATHRTAPSVESGTAPPQTPNDLSPSLVVAKTSAIPVGGGVVYASHGVVVTQPTSGTYKCFNSSCTHLGCTVNKVAAGLIQCPCHGAKFSIVDGSVKAGPALRALPAEDFTVEDGEIVLD